MTCCDTNILVFDCTVSAPEHGQAIQFLNSHLTDREFALSELTLVEFYVLIRNTAIFPKALSSTEAASVV